MDHVTPTNPAAEPVALTPPVAEAAVEPVAPTNPAVEHAAHILQAVEAAVVPAALTPPAVEAVADAEALMHRLRFRLAVAVVPATLLLFRQVADAVPAMQLQFQPVVAVDAVVGPTTAHNLTADAATAFRAVLHLTLKTSLPRWTQYQ